MEKRIKTFVLETDLLLFPEIQWDRFGEDYAFGWIKRDDGKFDFACLTYYQKDEKTITVSIISSSAKYSRAFADRLGTGGRHEVFVMWTIWLKV